MINKTIPGSASVNYILLITVCFVISPWITAYVRWNILTLSLWGSMYKQNCRILDDANQCQIQESVIHPEKITVGSGF